MQIHAVYLSQFHVIKCATSKHSGNYWDSGTCTGTCTRLPQSLRTSQNFIKQLTNDFIWCIASQGKSCGFGVDLHCSPQSLLRTICHTAEKRRFKVISGHLKLLYQRAWGGIFQSGGNIYMYIQYSLVCLFVMYMYTCVIVFYPICFPIGG